MERKMKKQEKYIDVVVRNENLYHADQYETVPETWFPVAILEALKAGAIVGYNDGTYIWAR